MPTTRASPTSKDDPNAWFSTMLTIPKMANPNATIQIDLAITESSSRLGIVDFLSLSSVAMPIKDFY